MLYREDKFYMYELCLYMLKRLKNYKNKPLALTTIQFEKGFILLWLQSAVK